MVSAELFVETKQYHKRMHGTDPWMKLPAVCWNLEWPHLQVQWGSQQQCIFQRKAQIPGRGSGPQVHGSAQGRCPIRRGCLDALRSACYVHVSGTCSHVPWVKSRQLPWNSKAPSESHHPRLQSAWAWTQSPWLYITKRSDRNLVLTCVHLYIYMLYKVFKYNFNLSET